MLKYIATITKVQSSTQFALMEKCQEALSYIYFLMIIAFPKSLRYPVVNELQIWILKHYEHPYIDRDSNSALIDRATIALSTGGLLEEVHKFLRDISLGPRRSFIIPAMFTLGKIPIKKRPHLETRNSVQYKEFPRLTRMVC